MEAEKCNNKAVFYLAKINEDEDKVVVNKKEAALYFKMVVKKKKETFIPCIYIHIYLRIEIPMDKEEAANKGNSNSM